MSSRLLLAPTAALLLALALPSAADETVRGTATARDATTVAIGGVRIRLDGLVLPDESRCGVVSCASAARDRLAGLVSGQEISCGMQRRLGHGIWQGRCKLADGTDPALVLLTEGLAEPAADASDNYRAAAKKAHQAGLGRFGS